MRETYYSDVKIYTSVRDILESELVIRTSEGEMAVGCYSEDRERILLALMGKRVRENVIGRFYDVSDILIKDNQLTLGKKSSNMIGDDIEKFVRENVV